MAAYKLKVSSPHSTGFGDDGKVAIERRVGMVVTMRYIRRPRLTLSVLVRPVLGHFVN
jgi:hypothetical protein